MTPTADIGAPSGGYFTSGEGYYTAPLPAAQQAAKATAFNTNPANIGVSMTPWGATVAGGERALSPTGQEYIGGYGLTGGGYVDAQGNYVSPTSASQYGYITPGEKLGFDFNPYQNTQTMDVLKKRKDIFDALAQGMPPSAFDPATRTQYPDIFGGYGFPSGGGGNQRIGSLNQPTAQPSPNYSDMNAWAQSVGGTAPNAGINQGGKFQTYEEANAEATRIGGTVGWSATSGYYVVPPGASEGYTPFGQTSWGTTTMPSPSAVQAGTAKLPYGSTMISPPPPLPTTKKTAAQEAQDFINKSYVEQTPPKTPTPLPSEQPLGGGTETVVGANGVTYFVIRDPVGGNITGYQAQTPAKPIATMKPLPETTTVSDTVGNKFFVYYTNDPDTGEVIPHYTLTTRAQEPMSDLDKQKLDLAKQQAQDAKDAQKRQEEADVIRAAQTQQTELANRWQTKRQGEQQIAAQMMMQRNELEAQKQARLAQLRANPASWIEYANLSGVAPVTQPWMLPLSYEQYGLQTGQAIPGYSTGGALPELKTPSAQYMARLNPSQREQYYGYQGARTGMSPSDIQYQLWSGAPPGGGYRGVRQLGYQR